MKQNERAQVPSGDEDPLLRDLLAGELLLDDPAVRERLTKDPEFASAVRDFERLAAKLDHVGTDERELLHRALANGPLAPDHGARDGNSPETVPAVASGSGGSRAARGWRPALVAAAAAAALLVGWLAWLERDVSAPPSGLDQLEGRMLSGSDFEIRVEDAASGSILRWDVQAGVGWFDVFVSEELPDGEYELLARTELFESELALDPAPWQSSKHPVVIRVEQHVDGIDEPVRQGSLWLPPAR